MNHEHNAPTSPPPADPELEARIVAWVLGEAAAAEIAALEPLVAARPELAVFKRRIEAVHGLVAAAARPDAAPLRLAPARRAKLLATLASASAVAGGAAPGQNTPAPKKSNVLPMPDLKKVRRKDRQWLFAIAACFVVMLMLAGIQLGTAEKTFSGSQAQIYRIRQEEEVTAKRRLQMTESARASQVAAMELAELKAASEADVSRLRSMAEDSSVLRRDVRSEAGWTDSAVPAGSPNERVYGALKFSPSVSRQGKAREFSAAPASPEKQEEEVVTLSPFQVTASETVGYSASTTLAGIRLNTELKDIGSAITVVTPEFLKDVGATEAKSALQYSGGVPPAAQRDDFLSKRKGGRTASAAPVALGGLGGLGGDKATDKDEEIVVLSPFEVTKDTSFLKGNRPLKKPKRPDPSATSFGMGPGGLNADQALQPAPSTPSTASTPSTSSTLSTGATPAAGDQPFAKKPAAPPPTADELSAAQEPVSTFSLHVSDASFKLALAALNSGSLPEPGSIRPEEFYNAFDYGDPAPAAGEPVSCRVEQAAHPFAQQRNLVRLAVRVPATGRGAGTPLRLTVLLDTSGSMERPDRRAAVRAALATLVGLLGPNDRLTLVGFARQPRLLAEAFDGNHASQALGLLDRTPAEGGTNLEEALKLGGELARRHFAATAQNRIVLLTDGAANLGDADPERLAAAIESLRSQRIAFDACGVGLEGIDDDMLEALTRKGDGRYYVLNSPEAADAGFARQLAGAFRPAAENVKLQVRFNPARVGRYRLVGFEKHRLREEDFRNDAVDAAEISSEEAAVAVYEIEALPQGEGELGEVFVRFRDPSTRTMVERSWTLPYEPRAIAFDRASPSLQLAGTAAALAVKLRGGPAGDRVDLDALAPVVNALRSRRPDDQRLQDLATLFEHLRRMKK